MPNLFLSELTLGWLNLIYFGYSKSYFLTLEKWQSSVCLLNWLQACEIVILGVLLKFGSSEKVSTLSKSILV